MEKALNIPNQADDAPDFQAGITEIVQEIERLREQMRLDQIEIERSQARTRSMLAQLTARRQVA